MRRWILLPLIVSACGRLEPIALRGVASEADAGVTNPQTDAGFGRDASVFVRDAGPQIDPERTVVGRALGCNLGEEEQVQAAIRVAACQDEDVRATAVTYIEAFDSGLFGTFVPYIEGLAGFEMRQGCAYWRCAASAQTCDALEACATPLPGRCRMDQRFETRCVGTELARCEFGELERVVDCADFGAQCIDGACQRERCRFGDFETIAEPTCSDDGTRLVICPGQLEMACEDFRPGSACRSFYVGGEAPVSWCSPTQEGVAGAYEVPGECSRGTFSYAPATRPPGAYACLEAGYDGCDERSCVP
ncbi:MAG: hypothetical protein RMA76_26405 [Deltaproteobacteria bacterium]